MAEVPFDPAKYGLKPINTSGGFDPAKYGLVPTKPNIIEEQHPEISGGTRFLLMNLSGGRPEVVNRYLSQKGFEVKDLGNFDFAVRKPGEKEYRKLDESGFDWQDLSDILGDLVKGVGATAGAILGGGTTLASGPGAIAGGIAGAAGGGAATEAGLMGIGKLAGLEPTLGEAGKAVGTEALWSGAGEGVLRGIATGVKAAKPLVSKVTGIFKTPLKAEHKLTGLDKLLAVKEAGEVVNKARGGLASIEERIASEIASRKAPEQGLKLVGGEYLERAPGTLLSAEDLITRSMQKPASEALRVMTPEAIEQAFRTSSNATIRFLTSLTHPAWGVKAKALQYVPEFKEILRRNFGEEILPLLGSEAMASRAGFLRRLATEKTQEELDTIAKSYANDIAKWISGDERFAALGKQTKEATERILSGKQIPEDIKTVENAITSVMRKYEETIGAAKEEIKSAIRKQRIARAEVKPSEYEPIFAGRGGNYLKDILGIGYKGTVGVIPRASYAAGVTVDKFVNLLTSQTKERTLQLIKNAPSKIQRLYQRTMAGFRAGEKGKTAFRIGMQLIAKDKDVRDYIENLIPYKKQ